MSNNNTTTAPITTTTAPVKSTDCIIITEEVSNPNVVFKTLTAYRVVVKGVLKPEVHFDRSDAVWAVTKLVLGASLNRR